MTEQPTPIRPMLLPERINEPSDRKFYLGVALFVIITASIAAYAYDRSRPAPTITQSCDRDHYGQEWQPGRSCTETLTWDGDGYRLTGIQWRDK